MLPQCIFKLYKPYDIVIKERGAFIEEKNIKYMTVTAISSIQSAENIDNYLNKLPNLEMIEITFGEYTPFIEEQLKKIKSSNCRMLTCTLWASLAAGRTDDMAVEEEKPGESWGWHIDIGSRAI